MILRFILIFFLKIQIKCILPVAIFGFSQTLLICTMLDNDQLENVTIYHNYVNFGQQMLYLPGKAAYKGVFLIKIYWL